MEQTAAATITHRRPGDRPGPEGAFVPRVPQQGLGHDRPRRVLMTTSGRRPTWAHSLDLAGALGRCGIEVVLANIGEAPSHVQLGHAAGLRNVQVFPNRFESNYSDDAWDEMERAGSWLLRMEDMVQPDLVHLNSYPFGSLPFAAPTLLEGHDCPICRSQATAGDATALWERYRESVGRAMRATRMLVTPTRAALSELAATYGHLPASRVIPIGRSTRGLAPAETKEELILSAGCFGDEAQNLSALEAVARRLRWPVTVMVDGCPGPGSTEERGIRVLEDPSSERLANWYGRASIFALPCSYEPAGLSVLEAALSGCALVLGDVPALRELWEGAALFVEPGNRDDLERALNLLMDEPKGLRGLGQRARARALLLSPERRAASFLETYAHMLREPAAPTLETQAS